MDKLNELYISSDWRDVAKFYDHFDTKADIISWLANRPKPDGRIIEYGFENPKDIIVVIPTINADGEYAQNDKEIFKGLPIIFVENKSKQKEPYFNYSHRVNQGIKKALEYNPKWIIVSNDDMYKIDESNVLVGQLSRIDYKRVDAVLTPNSDIYVYSDKTSLYRSRIALKIKRRLSDYGKAFQSIYKKFGIKYELINLKNELNLKNKDKISNLKYKLAYKLVYTIPHHQGCLLILSSEYCRKVNGNVLDETFVNGHEDVYLFYNLSTRGKLAPIGYKIGSYVGKSLGVGKDRALREIANEVYFEELLDKTNLIKEGLI